MKNDQLLIGCIYRSPHSNVTNDAKINDTLKKANNLGFSHVLISGDLNHPSLNWRENTSPPDGNHPSTIFMEAVQESFLTQHVTEPTHHRGNNTPNTLDLIFTNEEGMIEKLKYLALIGKSHHSLLDFNFCCYTKSTKSRVDKYRYDKGNYKEMREMMTSRNWNEDFRDKSTEQCWAILEESIRNASNKHTPKCTMGSKARKARPPWTNTKTITAVKRKPEAYMLYRETRN